MHHLQTGIPPSVFPVSFSAPPEQMLHISVLPDIFRVPMGTTSYPGLDFLHAQR